MKSESITINIIRGASNLWATARAKGKPTASKASLDADVVRAAIAHRASRGEREVVVITTNVQHLSRYATPYVTARSWEDESGL